MVPISSTIILLFFVGITDIVMVITEYLGEQGTAQKFVNQFYNNLTVFCRM